MSPAVLCAAVWATELASQGAGLVATPSRLNVVFVFHSNGFGSELASQGAGLLMLWLQELQTIT